MNIVTTKHYSITCSVPLHGAYNAEFIFPCRLGSPIMQSLSAVNFGQFIFVWDALEGHIKMDAICLECMIDGGKLGRSREKLISSKQVSTQMVDIRFIII